MTGPYDLLISGGTVVSGRGELPATLAIRSGRIAGVLDPSERPAAGEHIDATGLHVLPGAIDTHVHLRDPGGVEREDFTSGTSAAASGGVTTILEMPISEPPVNSGEVLARRAEQVQPRALVDYALYGGVGSENVEQVQLLAEAGAIAFKTFLYTPAPGREHEFAGLYWFCRLLGETKHPFPDTLGDCFLRRPASSLGATRNLLVRSPGV